MESIEKNYDGKNVIIYPFESDEFGDFCFIIEEKGVQTIDDSFR